MSGLSIPNGWEAPLSAALASEGMAALARFLEAEQAAGKTIYPERSAWFRALDLTPLDRVRVVILGQDPYHGPGQAHGLSFSVPPGVRPPPSLVNIYKELESDLGLKRPSHGFLEHWAKQGVLLLNTSLTVREGEAGSHSGHGWETFTDAIISYLGSRQQHIVFMLWGAHAGKKTSLIGQHHTVITSVHPSPLSAHRGFFGSRPFSQANRALSDHNQPEINWVIA